MLKRQRVRWLLALLLAGAMAGCVGPRAAADATVIDGVPFFPDDRYACGPASLAGVLGYWGRPIGKEAITDAIYSEGARGTLAIDLVWFAREQGFAVETGEGDLALLHQAIAAGHPVIVLVDYGIWRVNVNHFMVVIGHDRNGVIVNSGETRQAYIPNRELLKLWAKRQRWYLRVVGRAGTGGAGR